MKRCPQCAQTYSGDSMNFCLVDGTPLAHRPDSEETQVIKAGDLLTEARMKFSPELFRLYCLFGYETDERQSSSIWQPRPLITPVPSDLGVDIQERFSTWLDSKRQFVFDELVRGTWSIIRAGFSPREEETWGPVDFREDGSCTSIVAGPPGRWELVCGALQMHMDEGRTDYRYFMVASKGGLHSGLHILEDDCYSYIRLVRDR